MTQSKQSQATRALKFSNFLQALHEPTAAQRWLLQAAERLNEQRKDAE